MTKGESTCLGIETLSSVSVLSHELKSPLSVIRQLALMLTDVEISGKDRQAYLQHLVLTTDRALDLANDLSHASNLQPTLFPLEPVNPFAVCRSIAGDMSATEMLYGHQIKWPKPRQKVLVVANKYLLQRIISNFVNNAIKYTEPKTPIAVVLNQNSEFVRLGVRDYGPRISNREYKKILDDVDKKKSIRTRPESSGLGIYLAHQFALSMHSKIGLIRHRDGMTFFVDMPVSKQMSFV